MELFLTGEELGGILLDVLNIPDLGRLKMRVISSFSDFVFHKICEVTIFKFRNVRA
jgi:hypothetical protein